LQEIKEYKENNLIKPEVEWSYDGWIQLDMTIPESEEYAKAAAGEICKKMGLEDIHVIHSAVLHPSEGTYLELKAKVPFFVKKDELELPKKNDVMSDEELFEFFGIKFEGNDDMKPLFLENWDDLPPLRKDFDPLEYSKKKFPDREYQKDVIHEAKIIRGDING